MLTHDRIEFILMETKSDGSAKLDTAHVYPSYHYPRSNTDKNGKRLTNW